MINNKRNVERKKNNYYSRILICLRIYECQAMNSDTIRRELEIFGSAESGKRSGFRIEGRFNRFEIYITLMVLYL